MSHICEACDRPATRRCAGCKNKTAWYCRSVAHFSLSTSSQPHACSERCQRELWIIHIFECRPKKSINTAYYLARACWANRFPEDPQTCEDYGFTKTFTAQNQSCLLGLYQGIFKFGGIEPETVHKWRVQGILVEKIKEFFEAMPENRRGGYYPWFLRNQYIVDGGKDVSPDLVTDVTARAWVYAGGNRSDTSQMKKSVWYLKKYVTESDGELIPSVNYDYGFLNCKTEVESRALKNAYKRYFASQLADPIKLHEACTGGTLYDHISGIVDLKKPQRFKRLMQNPYSLPLADFPVESTQYQISFGVYRDVSIAVLFIAMYFIYTTMYV